MNDLTTTNTNDDGIKIASNPTRCSVCSRFIPEGFAVHMIRPGVLECVSHNVGTVAIDKGSAPWRDNEYTRPSTRRFRRFSLEAA